MFLASSSGDTFRQVLRVTQQVPRSLWDRNEGVGRRHHSLLPSLYAMRPSAHASFPGHFRTFQDRPEVCRSYQCPIGLVLRQECMRQPQCLLLSEATCLLAQSWSLLPHLEKYGVIVETFQSRRWGKINGTIVLIGYICTDCLFPSSLLKMCRPPSVERCSCLSHTPSHSRICELCQPEGAWQISKSSMGVGRPLLIGWWRGRLPR